MRFNRYIKLSRAAKDDTTQGGNDRNAELNSRGLG
jgi:hypothetical protein